MTELQIIQLWNTFLFNWPSTFFEDVWKDDEHMRDHLRAKFTVLYEERGPTFAMARLYMELDERNRELLSNYALSLKEQLIGK